MTDVPASGDASREGRPVGPDGHPDPALTGDARPEPAAVAAAGDETPPDDSAQGAEEYDAVPASEHVAHGEPGADLVDEPIEPDVPAQDEPRHDPAPPALVEPPESAASGRTDPEPPAAVRTDPEHAAAVRTDPEPPAREPEPGPEREFRASDPEAVAAVPDPAAPAPASAAPAATTPAAGALPPAAAPTSSYFVEPPVPPKARHNRGFGVGIALLSSLIFAALYGAVVIGISVFYVTAADFAQGMTRFLASPAFWVPVIAYAVFAVLTALILNRARWAAHVFFSLLVGLLVYASSVGVILLIEGVLARSGREQLILLVTALAQPVLLAAAICAREVALWTGLATAARGRRVVARNKADREAYEQEKGRSEAVWDEPARAV
ncbi:MAG: hypothetical protein HY996_07660 [Micrococcales bacterium]|nr:hypothetical protein [Micrococcales bacterium]